MEFPPNALAEEALAEQLVGSVDSERQRQLHEEFEACRVATLLTDPVVPLDEISRRVVRDTAITGGMEGHLPARAARERRGRRDDPIDEMDRTWGFTEALTLAVAGALTAFALTGFLVTGFDDITGFDRGETLLGFDLNPMHNLVNLAMGVVGLFAWSRYRAAMAYGTLLLAGYGALAIYGVAAVNADWDPLALDEAGNWLHLGLAMAGALILLVGLWELREVRIVSTESAVGRTDGDRSES
jgi:hypothetical protein